MSPSTGPSPPGDPPVALPGVEQPSDAGREKTGDVRAHVP
jgi:hypothetical protein